MITAPRHERVNDPIVVKPTDKIKTYFGKTEHCDSPTETT